MRFPVPLPIDPLVPEIVASLAARPNAVVVAPPGAGKTTRVPPAIAEALLPRGAGHSRRSVVLLQPRRVAARAAANRIAQEQEWRLGEEVGYRIRFENRTSARTFLHVVTEGILTRRIQSDPFLQDVGCVILDEFHERGIHTDLAIALLREIQETVRQDLRIVVMSATLDPGRVAAFLGDAPVFRCEGRLHPVAIQYQDRSSRSPMWEQSAAAVRSVLEPGSARRPTSSDRNDDVGHVLVFLPGIGEIRRTQELLRGADADLHILHSSVSDEEQDRAIRPSARRKIILATNIAETSLTIDGVKTVVDTGYARVLVNDARLGIDRLELRRVSLASAAQRAGRAGRTAPGRCLRLWTRAEESSFPAREVPEVERIDLASTALALRDYGARKLDEFGWFERPRADALARAENLLQILGAVDKQGGPTPVGKRLAALPLHPRLGRLLLAGEDAGRLHEAATLAAMLSERDFLAAPHAFRKREAKWESASDVLDRLDLLESGAVSSELDPQAIRAIERVRDELILLIRRSGKRAGAAHETRDQVLLRVLLHAYPDRVTLRRAGDPTRGVMVGGRGVVLEPSCTVRKAALFLSVDARDAAEGAGRGAPSKSAAGKGAATRSPASESRVSLASAIQEEWLAQVFPDLWEQRLLHRFDAEKGKVLGIRETVFAGLVIREDVVGANPKIAGQTLFDHLRKNAADFFMKDDAAAAWLARARFLARQMPELALPPFDADALSPVLRAACEGCVSLDQVRARNLRRLLEGCLNAKQRRALKEFAPEFIQVPSGSRVRLSYPEDGSRPVLAVRLQEMFGLAETPRMAKGRVPVMLHLLGPNMRPVQITADLKSFWNTTYAEVRKELRARYPKHSWPEDPWSAPPARGAHRRKPR